MNDATLDPRIGTTVAGRYRVKARIGQGGMGAIYLATQEPLGRQVVLKVLLEAFAHDRVAVSRFEKEALSVSRLLHPNIVTLFDFGHTEKGELFIAMEYLHGRSLREVVYGEGRLAWRRATRIVSGIAQGLAEAHRHEIVHRDLKPENVMIVRSGEDHDFPKILDFGLARSLDAGADEERERLTQQNMVPGTPAYIAPERVNGLDDDGRSDLYSLGALWFELVTGRVPFDAPTPIKVVVRHLQDPPPRPSEVAPDNSLPPELERLLLRLLAKVPDERPRDARELVRLLSPWLTDEDWSATQPRELSDPNRPAPEVEALREWARGAGEIPDLDFGAALGLEDAPVLLTQPKDADAPIELVRRKDLVGPDVEGAVLDQLDPLTDPFAPVADPSTAGPAPASAPAAIAPAAGPLLVDPVVPGDAAPSAPAWRRAAVPEPFPGASAGGAGPRSDPGPPVPGEFDDMPGSSPPLLDTEEVPRPAVARARERTGPIRSVAEAAARLSRATDGPELASVIVRFLRLRFDRALVLDLRPVPFRVLAADGFLPLDEPVLVFERALGLWGLVRRREPYYGPALEGGDWDLLFQDLSGRRPGALLVATLRRGGTPALTLYAEHDQPELFSDLSDVAVLLKEAAAALTSLGQ